MPEQYYAGDGNCLGLELTIHRQAARRNFPYFSCPSNIPGRALWEHKEMENLAERRALSGISDIRFPRRVPHWHLGIAVCGGRFGR